MCIKLLITHYCASIWRTLCCLPLWTPATINMDGNETVLHLRRLKEKIARIYIALPFWGLYAVYKIIDLLIYTLIVWFLWSIKILACLTKYRYRCAILRSPPSIVRPSTIYSFETTFSQEQLDEFSWNLEGKKNSWFLTGVVVFHAKGSRADHI